MIEPDEQTDVLLTADVIAAYVAHNPISTGDLPSLIRAVHAQLQALRHQPASSETALPTPTPAVPIKKSVTPEFIICLDDGKKFKSMKRHLRLLGMTPDEYRAKWGLPADYPMVAPNYASTRSALALTAGLGRKQAPTPDPVRQETSTQRARKAPAKKPAK